MIKIILPEGERTIEEWFNLLPKELRQQAFSAMTNKENKDLVSCYLSFSFYLAFNWDNSAEGHEYWENISNSWHLFKPTIENDSRFKWEGEIGIYKIISFGQETVAKYLGDGVWEMNGISGFPIESLDNILEKIEI